MAYTADEIKAYSDNYMANGGTAAGLWQEAQNKGVDLGSLSSAYGLSADQGAGWFGNQGVNVSAPSQADYSYPTNTNTSTPTVMAPGSQLATNTNDRSQQFTNAWQNGNYGDLQSLINQVQLTGNSAASQWGLSPENLAYIRSKGINFAGDTSSPASAAAPSLATGGAGAPTAPPAAQSWLDVIKGGNYERATGLGGHAFGADTYFDPTTNRYYTPTYSESRNGADGEVQRTLVGYNGFDNGNDYVGRTNYTYDTNGNQTGNFQTQNFNDPMDNVVLGMIGAMAAAGAFGLGGSAGGASTGATGATAFPVAGSTAVGTDLGLLGGAAAPGAATAGAGGLYSLAGGTGATAGGTGLGLSTGATTGLSSTIAGTGLSGTSLAGAGAAAAAGLGGGSSGTGFNVQPGTGLNLTTPNGNLPGMGGGTGLTVGTVGEGGTNLVSRLTGMGFSPEVAGRIITNGLGQGLFNTGTAVDQAIANLQGRGLLNSNGTVPNGTGTGGVTINNNNGAGTGANSGLATILQLLAGAQGSNAQHNAAQEQRAYIDSQMNAIQGLYAPGSPEHTLLQQEMERKDAAAGRNSQYGTRAVDLAAKIAEIKAKQRVALLGVTNGSTMSAINQDNTSLNALLAALGQSFGGAGGTQNLSSLLNLIS